MLRILQIWFNSLMSSNILKLFQEVRLGQNFSLSDELSDDVLELVVNKNDRVTVLGFLLDLVSDRSSSWEIDGTQNSRNTSGQLVREGSR